MNSPHDLRVPWHTHWYRAVRAPFGGDAKPWHTHLWRGLLSLCGSRKYAPPSARELLEALLIETRAGAAHHATTLTALADSVRLAAASAEVAATELNYQRNRTNKTVLRHIADLGQSESPAVVSHDFASTTATLEPMLTPRPGKIAVCTVGLGVDYRETVRDCLESQTRYCERHGHTYADLRFAPSFQVRPASWYKLPLVHQLLRAGHTHVLYLDADCLVTNPAFQLEELAARLDKTSPKKSLLITVDEFSVNCGVFFIRNTPDAFRLLNLLWLYDARAPYPNWEQDALHRLLEDHPAVLGAIEIEQNSKLFNSFPPERHDFFRHLTNRPNVWSPGDFLCHFSGIRPPHLQRMIGQYADKTADV
jgi:hypothetical protein